MVSSFILQHIILCGSYKLRLPTRSSFHPYRSRGRNPNNLFLSPSIYASEGSKKGSRFLAEGNEPWSWSEKHVVTKSNEKYSLSRLADRNLAHHVLESPGLSSLGSKPTLPTQFYLSIFLLTSWIGADTRNWSTKPTSKGLSASCNQTPSVSASVFLEFSFWLSTRQHGTLRLLTFHQLVPFLMDGITR